GIVAGLEPPDARLEERSDDLLLSVAVEVAHGQEATEAVVELGDRDALIGRRVGLVAPDLAAVDQCRALRVLLALGEDVELVLPVTVDVVDQDLLRVALAEIGDDLTALALLRHVAHDVALLLGAV